MKKWTIGACLILLTSCYYQDANIRHSEASSEWTMDSTTHFKLHAQKGVRSEESLKTIGAKMEGIQQDLLGILQEEKETNMDVFFLKDRETLASYTGFAANGYTNTQKSIIYFVDKDPFHLPLKHELMHALSWRLWGNPSGYWMSEGMAVFASGGCSGYNLHALSHDMNQQGKLASFPKLLENFDFKSPDPSLQSASMVLDIYDTYGVKALKGFWVKGWWKAQDIIGITPDELEKRWRKHIEQEKFEANVDWEQFESSGCE